MEGKELTRVVGIGPARARWFEQTYGVRSLPELAALDPAEVEERLRATSQSRTPLPTLESVGRWIADAARMAGDSRIAGAPAAPSSPPRAHLTADVDDAAGGAPVDVVRSSDAWSVRCAWYVDGPAAATLKGRWRVELLAEGQGPAPELESQPVFLPIDGRVGPPPAPQYELIFAIAPGAVTLGSRAQVLLDLTVALTHLRPGGAPGPVAAFAKAGKLMVFAA